MNNTITCTPLSGKDFEVSDNCKMFVMKVLWNAAVKAPQDSIEQQVLDEAHAIMSAVLYGKIIRVCTRA